MKTDLLPLRLTSVYSADAMVASGVRPWHLMCCRSSASLGQTKLSRHMIWLWLGALILATHRSDSAALLHIMGQQWDGHRKAQPS